MCLMATPCPIPLTNLYREDILKTQNIDQIKKQHYQKGSSETLYSEAAREKINHFLRKFILFFVSLFVTLFHFLKSDVTVAFYFTNYI